jgi:hypothetical protein
MFPAMNLHARSTRGSGGSIHRSSVTAIGAAMIVGALAGCSKKDAASTTGAMGSSVPGAPVAVSSSAVRVRPVALTAEPEKVWASAVSVGTGLTATELDAGRVAVGAESGRGPVVVSFDASGEGHEAHIGVKKELTSELKKEDGKREILRVTPALGSGGEVIAFVDYREVGDARRLVDCGPSDSTEELLKFEGKPLVDAGDEAGEKGKPEEAAKLAPAASASKAQAPPAKPAPAASGAKSAAPAAKPQPTGAKPAAAASGAKPAAAKPPGPPKPPTIKEAPPKPAAAAPAKPAPAKPGEAARELRECRTLVDRGGAHAWAVGSEIVGKPAADGTTDYSIVLFTEQERGRGRADLSTSPLGKNPTKIPVYEAATVYDMGGGSFALAARFRGALFAWVLDASKHAKGAVRVYSGGFPAQPRFANLGSEQILIVVQSGAGGQKSARAARFSPDVAELPSALSDLVVPEHALEPPVSAAAVSATSPYAGQRFIAYQSDESVKRLSVVQIDGNLAATGEPLTVDVGVRDSELFALPDGRLLVVYLRVDATGKSELVSKVIRLG